ncbi:MAG: SDR family oxidoreductase [Chloroflexi bacterium]|nr:SDR family oxidoreductase [Chloroflexota bacterium]
MKVLFIGGTGIISSACSRLALERGIDLYLLNRGQSARPIPPGAKVLLGDIHDPASARAALGGHRFDAVVNWIVFTPDQLDIDFDLFRGRTGQYVFISSASAYQTPPVALPVTEATLLDNPYWEYSRNKIACEERLVRAYREEKFPITIVRPSHTYDERLLPFHGGWTMMERMLQGKPVVVPGDGTSLWTLTHNTDFAKGFVPLLGNPQALGNAFQITADELLTWNQIYEMLAAALGVRPNLVHVPSELIAAYDKIWGDSLLGDKAHSMIFDNTRIKRLVPDFACTVPFARGAEQIVAWHMADPARRTIEPYFDALLDRIIAGMQRAYPNSSQSI